MNEINDLKFDKDGLIPAVVVDFLSGDVLTLAYMNAESLQISIREGRTCFWSRSRGKLWRKGESSGNIQNIVSIKADCDMDALLIYVNKTGPACHTNANSCFFNDVHISDTRISNITKTCETQISSADFSLKTLNNLIHDRKVNPKKGSYTNYLFDKGIDKILKKIGEEATEVVIASKDRNKSEVVYELADLTYHVFVLMMQLGIEPGEVLKELESRYVDKKEDESKE